MRTKLSNELYEKDLKAAPLKIEKEDATPPQGTPGKMEKGAQPTESQPLFTKVKDPPAPSVTFVSITPTQRAALQRRAYLYR